MPKLTHDVPPELQSNLRRDVTPFEVEEALSAAQQAEELEAALGVPERVGAVLVPVPGLVALALLEQIESPFLAESGGELVTMDVLQALFVISKPREAAAVIARGVRAVAALDTVRERAAQDPALWDRYLDAVAMSGRAAWDAFDEAVTAFGLSLGTVPVMELAGTLAHQIAIASRGYEMIPEDPEHPKAEAASESSGLPLMP